MGVCRSICSFLSAATKIILVNLSGGGAVSLEHFESGQILFDILVFFITDRSLHRGIIRSREKDNERDMNE